MDSNGIFMKLGEVPLWMGKTASSASVSLSISHARTFWFLFMPWIQLLFGTKLEEATCWAHPHGCSAHSPGSTAGLARIDQGSVLKNTAWLSLLIHQYLPTEQFMLNSSMYPRCVYVLRMLWWRGMPSRLVGPLCTWGLKMGLFHTLMSSSWGHCSRFLSER